MANALTQITLITQIDADFFWLARPAETATRTGMEICVHLRNLRNLRQKFFRCKRDVMALAPVDAPRTSLTQITLIAQIYADLYLKRRIVRREECIKKSAAICVKSALICVKENLPQQTRHHGVGASRCTLNFLDADCADLRRFVLEATTRPASTQHSKNLRHSVSNQR